MCSAGKGDFIILKRGGQRGEKIAVYVHLAKLGFCYIK